MTRRLAVLSIIVVGALVGACTDEPTAPSGAPAVGVSAPAVQLGLPTVRRNSIKYRDAGMKPATGRSGSATVSARALVGRDGRATLEVTTGSFESAAAAPGNIDKLQIKLLENNKVGRQLVAQNYNGLTGGGTWSAPLPVGLGQTLQVQAHVSGIDANRTDVVVVRERVKRRPDVEVASIDVPAKPALGADVAITALISELNGDLGARANCVLYVDKAEADRANGIWVDAGRSVSCEFRHRFATAGSKVVRVEVEGITPGDWDARNNAASATVLVEEPVNVLYAAAVRDHREAHTTRNEWSYNYSTSAGYASTQSGVYDNTQTTADRAATLNGFTSWKPDGSVAFPLKRFEFSHSSGSVTAAAALADVPEAYSDYESVPGSYEREEHCANGWSRGTLGKIVFEACIVRKRILSGSASAGDPPADGQWYSRVEVMSMLKGGDVTYMSTLDQMRYNVVGDDNDPGCLGAGPEGNDYCNYYYENGVDPLPALGPTYSMSFVVAGANGVAQDARADVALDQLFRPYPTPDGSAFTDALVLMHECYPDSGSGTGINPDGSSYTYNYSSNTCLDERYQASGRSGSVYRLQPTP